jgi:hypothetical protein
MAVKLKDNLTLKPFSINIRIGYLQYKKNSNKRLSSTDCRNFYG